ncbi:MerR family transcriptional regulator [Lentibacillus kapialis]|uniref:MerR family transcriptional regulator n=1 Tax=Lentibacillus kapialis TaxID=340214 RepID=A0A917PN94_9BACI|nr:MerR family transcriptional regulator [Lentibacillus kapialis]GGJ84711.1 MerR family transcriptional regulator [Lentibacillus kapialis]
MVNLAEKHYYIKEVAKLTGLSEQLIRKWENRYHIIKPKRLNNGYRVYTHEDIITLTDLKEIRDQGKPMKAAIQTVLANKDKARWYEKLDLVEPSHYVSKLIERGTIYDENGLIFLLKQANHQYGLDLFLQNTVRPFMEKIGLLWEKEEWDESQEIVSSLVVRDFLTQISRNFSNYAQAPHALGFCLPDELHEIPLQIVLLQMRMQGWRTTRIGASPKFTAIERLIDRIQPHKVLFSASTLIPFQQNENLLEELDAIAARYSYISFYIGGKGVWEYTELVKPKHMDISFTVDDVLR